MRLQHRFLGADEIFSDSLKCVPTRSAVRDCRLLDGCAAAASSIHYAAGKLVGENAAADQDQRVRGRGSGRQVG